MKKLLTILFAVALGLNLSAQTDYVDDCNPDADGDDLIGITDLLALLRLFAEAYSIAFCALGLNLRRIRQPT